MLKLLHKIWAFLAGLAFFLTSGEAMAEDRILVSIAALSDRLLVPTEGLARLIISSSMVLGVGLLVSSVIQYSNHRKNPSYIRLSQPVTVFILGCVLVGLPLIAHYSAGAQYVGH